MQSCKDSLIPLGVRPSFILRLEQQSPEAMTPAGGHTVLCAQVRTGPGDAESQFRAPSSTLWRGGPIGLVCTPPTPAPFPWMPTNLRSNRRQRSGGCAETPPRRALGSQRSEPLDQRVWSCCCHPGTVLGSGTQGMERKSPCPAHTAWGPLGGGLRVDVRGSWGCFGQVHSCWGR